MKKIIALCMVLLLSITMMGCQGSSQADKTTNIDFTTIIKENGFQDLGFDKSGTFYSYEFSGINIQVIFNQSHPQEYFADRSLLATDIKSIEVIPDKNKTNQWVYLIFENNQAVIDEKDLKAYANKGRTEAHQALEKKLKELSLTIDDIGKFTINYFNETVREELLNKMKDRASQLAAKIEKAGYNIQRDTSQRVIISQTNEECKIVISAKQCMVVDQEMDLSGGKKNGYMYIPSQGTGGYIQDDETTVTYRYSDNSVLLGQPSLEQFVRIKELKKWYDQFLKEFETDTASLQFI